MKRYQYIGKHRRGAWIVERMVYFLLGGDCVPVPPGDPVHREPVTQWCDTHDANLARICFYRFPMSP